MTNESNIKIVLERSYNVPLRKEWLKSPKHKRAQKAISALKKFLLKHMKGTEIKLGKKLNEEIWKHGMKNPPHHIKVNVTKDDKGIIRAELFGFKYEEKKKEPKVEKSKLEEMKEKVLGKETVEKAEKEAKEAVEKEKGVEEKIEKKETKEIKTPDKEKTKKKTKKQ